MLACIVFFFFAGLFVLLQNLCNQASLRSVTVDYPRLQRSSIDYLNVVYFRKGVKHCDIISRTLKCLEMFTSRNFVLEKDIQIIYSQCL